MGFFKKLAGLVSNPIRGLGRIARGDIEKGLGDITGTAKVVAPFVPGVGWAATAGLNLADRAFNDKPITLGSTVKDVGGAWLGDKILNRMNSPQPSGANSVLDGAPGLGLAKGATGPSGLGLSAKAINPSISQKLVTAATMPNAAKAVAPMVSARAPNVGRSVLDRLGLGDLTGGDKVDLISQGLGAGANVYGAHQMGKAEDERIAWEREQAAWEQAQVERKNRRQASTDPMRAEILKMIMGSLR